MQEKPILDEQDNYFAISLSFYPLIFSIKRFVILSLNVYPFFSKSTSIFSNLEPRTSLKLFLNTKCTTLLKTLRNIFQSFLMFYYIIKLSNSLYFVLVMQKYI